LIHIAKLSKDFCLKSKQQYSSICHIYPQNRPMSMETLEFIIFPDGRVQEKVTGIVGASCQEVTAAIEAQLGRVMSQENTDDYYTQPIHQSAKTSNQASLTDW
jgi:hypothetical protein